MLETKLLAGKTGYDVVVPSASYLQRLVGADVFLKLDKAKIPNLKYASPEIVARLATYDPGNLHALNYMWGTTGTEQTKRPIVPVDYVLPKEGALMWFDSFAISKDALLRLVHVARPARGEADVATGEPVDVLRGAEFLDRRSSTIRKSSTIRRSIRMPRP
jgi:hypothetical protein